MKKLFLALFVFGLCFSIHGQELMTIGEVFNFEIGDEFQIEGTADNEPPNADRITIIGKYYSFEKDTLFYIRFHNSYYSEVIWGGNPYLEYHFWTKTDTVSYTDLDSSILYFDQGFEFNRYIENSSELCDSLINGCSYESGPGFEDDYIINEYGKGLGQSYAYFYSGQGHAVLWANSLFYYKKGDYECGIPDSTTVGIDEKIIEKLMFTIYPNPVKSVLNIKNNSLSDFYQCRIINSTGQIIVKKGFKGQQNKINIDYLKGGIYFLSIKTENYSTIKKFIKK